MLKTKGTFLDPEPMHRCKDMCAAPAWSGRGQRSAFTLRSMKRPATLTMGCLLLVGTGTCTAQTGLAVDSAFKLIKTRSVHRHAVDWPVIEAAFTRTLKSAATEGDSANAVVDVFRALNDVHSQFIVGDRTRMHYEGVDDSVHARIGPMLAVASARTNTVRAQRIGGRFLYVQLPGIQAWGEATDRYAQMIRDSLARAAGDGVGGCVLDLRLNTGGQVASMLGGVRALLGNGALGSSVDADDQVVWRLSIANGQFAINENPLTAIQGTEPDLSRIPVVVLIGPLTASSGTLTAIAFKGRPDTHFIGEPTAAGYSTGNDIFPLPPTKDGRYVALNLATAINRDRIGVAYPVNVVPDGSARGAEDFDDPMKDALVQQALRWLRTNKQ